MKYRVSAFDLRKIDYQSGKRLTATSEEKIACECCGRKIAKGIVLNTGEKVGTECAEVGQLLRNHGAKRSTLRFLQISERQAGFFGFTVVD